MTEKRTVTLTWTTTVEQYHRLVVTVDTLPEHLGALIVEQNGVVDNDTPGLTEDELDAVDAIAFDHDGTPHDEKVLEREFPTIKLNPLEES